MRAMRAEEFSGYKGLKLVDLPKPAGRDGKVLLRIAAAGVTPLDHTILSGQYPRATAPLVLSGEGAAVVEEGGGSDFPVGSRVMFAGRTAFQRMAPTVNGLRYGSSTFARYRKPSTMWPPRVFRSPISLLTSLSP
jgi:NADPH:quinone reductase-like Zn-dependent oxidoreductase